MFLREITRKQAFRAEGDPPPSCVPVREDRTHGGRRAAVQNYSPRDFWMISSATAFGTSE
ncbi:hypothetical protein GCM10009849_13140 [Sinomonas flava]|uniref:Uncharacterized protein n=1 Tax=Sinomonas flava TaxID=496857 RepID=A0ABN3BQX6_9MICC